MDLNHRRPALQAGALPTELPMQFGSEGGNRTHVCTAYETALAPSPVTSLLLV